MQSKTILGAAMSGMFTLAALQAASAQQTTVPETAAEAPAPLAETVPPAPVEPSPVTVDMYPYLWLPIIDTNVKFSIPGGGTASSTLSVGPDAYIPKLNLGAMLAGDLRYQRFSLFSDFMYLDLGATGERIRTFDFGRAPVDATRYVQSTSGTRIRTAIWTLAGGYKIAEGDWGTVESFAGLRVVSATERTNLSLALGLSRPDGTAAIGRSGSLSADATLADGIAGVRGRAFIGGADAFGGGRFFIPLYLDVGGGGNFTWQGFTGLGYQSETFGVTLGYRYMDFQQGGGAVIRKLQLGGPIITGNLTF